MGLRAEPTCARSPLQQEQKGDRRTMSSSGVERSDKKKGDAVRVPNRLWLFKGSYFFFPPFFLPPFFFVAMFLFSLSIVHG
jgi:hypothetical protein